ncbi:MAG TPA: sigma-70 family RNA polymerase sigma factor [Holophagaceae bacterium]|jgi:RNA polymerase sigma factor (sigma-70 family)|nr:sigma-70 family RNA polymerase sigma factor [Holophagaceae bacterium]
MTSPATQAAFLDLLNGHQKILYKVANTYCWNAGDREDLVQEITIQLWRSYPGFDGRCRFSTWATRIALNVAISFVRQVSTRDRHLVSGEEHMLDIADGTTAPSAELQFLHSFIQSLGGLDKALLLLYLDGNSHQEIADVLGITATNVATKIGRLKQRLRETASH